MKEKLYFYKFINVKVIFINIYNSRKAGLEYNWREMIKLNNGRNLTDNFYILIHDNEEETKKSTKTCIIESKETLLEKVETPEVIDNISNKDKEQMENL